MISVAPHRLFVKDTIHSGLEAEVGFVVTMTMFGVNNAIGIFS